MKIVEFLDVWRMTNLFIGIPKTILSYRVAWVAQPAAWVAPPAAWVAQLAVWAARNVYYRKAHSWLAGSLPYKLL